MVYECENCAAALGPGLTVCPHCGQIFDEPVPDDALWDEATLVVPDSDLEAALPALADAAPPEAVRSPRLSRWPRTAAVLLFLGLGWLGFRHWNAPAAPTTLVAPFPRPPTDLAAHPHYATNMTALVQKLRAMGVGAEWPAFGSNDVLLVTPRTRAAELPMAWDADMDRRLAQGIYGDFAQTRFESGFPDSDTTACFVFVTNGSGKVMAVDFMGNLK